MADEKKDDLKTTASTPAPLTKRRRRSHETQVLQPLEVIDPGDLLEGSANQQTPTAQQAMGYSAIIPADGNSEIELLFAEVLPPSPSKASPLPPLTPPPRSNPPSGDVGSSEQLASLDYHDYDAPPEDLSSPSQPMMIGAAHETAEMPFELSEETESSASTKKESIPNLPRDTAPIVVKPSVPQSIKTTSIFQINSPVEPGDLIGDMIDSVMKERADSVAPTEKLPVHSPSTTIKETTTFSLPVDLRSPEALIGEYLDQKDQGTDVSPVVDVVDTAQMAPVEPTSSPSTPTPRTTRRTPHRETLIFGSGSTEDLDAALPLANDPDAALRAVASSVTERDTDIHASLAVANKPTDVINRKTKKPKVHAQGKGPRRYLPEVPPQDAVPTQQALQAVDTPVQVDQESVRDTQERQAPDSAPPPSQAPPASTPGARQDTLASPLQPRPTKPQSRIPFVQLKQGQPELQSDLRPRYQEIQPLNSQHPDELTESVLCQDNDLQRQVIHKRLRPQLHTPTQIPRFMEQLQLRSQLDHPSIPPVYDAGVDAKGCYYFTEKYVSGDSLDLIIAKLRQGDTSYHKRFGARTRIEIISSLIHVLRFAHAKGIVHGDLSPACIIVGPFGDIALRGWELAAQLQNHPEKPKACQLPSSWSRPEQEASSPFQRHINHEVGDLLLTGTPAYLAPERLHGAPPDERSDIYSLCAIIYEFLTLHHYLEASRGKLDALLKDILHKTPAPVSRLNSAQPSPLPENVTRILAHGLAKDPGQRPTRFESLYAAFHLSPPPQTSGKLSPLLIFTMILCVGLAAYGALQLGLQAWSFWTGQP